jgi:PTS system cellobiose-specific IIC component
MKKLMEFVEKHVAPFANKLSRNSIVASLTSAIMIILPFTLVGTVVTILGVIGGYVSWLPNFSLIGSFSFGLAGLVMAFTFPYFIMEKRKMHSKKILAAAASIGIFLFFCSPAFTSEGTIVFAADHLGASGIFLGLVSGGLTYTFFALCSKFSFFKKQGSIPDYIVANFDAFVPVLLLMLTGWLVVGQLQIDFFVVLQKILSPLVGFGQSYAGLLVYVLGLAILFFFGISPWALYGIFYPIFLSGIVQNGEAVAKDLVPTNITTTEVIGTFVSMGGTGATLMLAFLLLMSRSKKLKTIGRIVIIPSLLNINEPLVYGTPVVLNPFLFIPFVLNPFVNATVTYLVLKLGLVKIPSQVFSAWFLPGPIQAWLNTQDWRALILIAVLLALNFIIWFPFWKIYDNQQFELEQNSLKEKNA